MTAMSRPGEIREMPEDFYPEITTESNDGLDVPCRVARYTHADGTNWGLGYPLDQGVDVAINDLMLRKAIWSAIETHRLNRIALDESFLQTAEAYGVDPGTVRHKIIATDD